MLGVKHVIRGVRLGRLVPQLSLTLLQRFILIGAVATVLLASGTAFWTSRYLVQRELQETSQDIADIVTHLVTPQVSEPTKSGQNRAVGRLAKASHRRYPHRQS